MMHFRGPVSVRLQKVYLIATLAIAVGISLSNASAGVIKPGAAHFNTIGLKSSFQWAPDNYSDATHPSNFTYDIFYYIPERLKNLENVNALIFNHGGGSSTLTRDGSIAVVVTSKT
jgi:hypothetical protein